ncbi:hypothetical protein UVI_02047120 [Ustilaginoidea virens]|uniref:Uncharacterized protein n=1 Tax=Ustilaginoidea virens TaxID=1159556 RepID=A0A1B5L5D3_USTVR|nr:hypothetical protein UVI_02047120 [Ustilaginoidea virens]
MQGRRGSFVDPFEGAKAGPAASGKMEEVKVNQPMTSKVLKRM